jgi:hypothetical protein
VVVDDEMRRLELLGNMRIIDEKRWLREIGNWSRRQNIGLVQGCDYPLRVTESSLNGSCNKHNEGKLRL